MHEICNLLPITYSSVFKNVNPARIHYNYFLGFVI